MKACNDCHVHVRTDSGFCHLWGAELLEGAHPEFTPTCNRYPDLARPMAPYNLIKRIPMFVAILVRGMCLVLNLRLVLRFL